MDSNIPTLVAMHLRSRPAQRSSQTVSGEVAREAGSEVTHGSDASVNLRVPALWCVINLTVSDFITTYPFYFEYECDRLKALALVLVS